MVTQSFLLLLIVAGYTSAVLYCDHDRGVICYVRNQKLLPKEDFQINRTTPFTDLIFGSMQLTLLPQTIFTNYPNITFLSVNDNQLKVLSVKTFANAGKLKKLFLAHGSLMRIPNGVFKSCVSLEDLQLFGHKITTIMPNAFQGLGNLMKLTLSNGKMDFNYR
jgi:Leucine-rich repeat (LRR) protein